MTLVVVLFGLVMFLVITGNAFPCPWFTTSRLHNQDSGNFVVNITLKNTCTDLKQLNLLTMKETSSATSWTSMIVCQVVPLNTKFVASSPNCQLTVDDTGLTITRTFDRSQHVGGVIGVTATFMNSGTITSEVPISVPPLTGLFITTTTHPAKDPVKPTGSKKDSDVDSAAPSGQGGPDAEADVTQPALQLISKFVTQLAEDITSGLKQGEDTRDVDGGIVKRDGGNNDTSFLQTPIFSLIMIVAFVGVIVLMVVLLLRQRGVVLPTLRRNRNSVTVPENYEHPSSHHYDRHLPSAPQTQRVLNPTFNRDSVGAQDYSVIDEDLEMEAVPAASPGHDVDYSYCL